MKVIVGGESKGMLGDHLYTHSFRRGLGHFVTWDNPPPAGTRLLNGKDQVTVDEIVTSGMLAVTRLRDTAQLKVFPWELKPHQ